MRPKREEIIRRELIKWKDRVWREDIDIDREFDDQGNIKVKPNAAFDALYARPNFTFAFAADDEQIYRFLRYGIETCKVYNSKITFARKSVFEAYIDAHGSISSSYKLCDQLIDIIAKDYDNKWLVCEDLDAEFNDKLAVYFITQLQRRNVRGIIIHCDPKLPNNIYSCVKSSSICDIVQI